MTKKVTLILLAVVLLASALRLYKLGENPPGLTWDEASLGYNAYSIYKTGADEYGHYFPLTLKSFGDYKPALYAYTVIPSVAVFGLSEFAVRLPNALFGISAVLLMFFVVRRLFGNPQLALISAFVLAISPWHLHFSRAAWEANTAFTIVLLGLLLFLKGLEKPKWFIGSAIFFTLSLYTYQSSRLFVPLLAVGLLLIYRKQLFPLRTAHILAACIGFVMLLPFLFTIVQADARKRLDVQSLFSYSRPDTETNELAKADNISSSSATFRLFHSQKELWGRAIIERELNYLSPAYLFVTGDSSPRHRTPNVAHGYLVELPFYILGLYALARNRWQGKSVLLLWLLLAPLPAVLSRDSTTALRSLQLVFGIDVVIAIGLWWFFTQITSVKKRVALKAIYTALLLANILFYLDDYYVHMPKKTSEYWLTGYKDVISQIKNSYNYFDSIVFTTDYNAPYIFLLFYLQIDPTEFQKQSVLSATRGIDVGEVEHFNQFEFRHIYWPDDRSVPKTLYIGTEEELPEKDLITEPRAQLLNTIRFANGRIAFKIVETK